MSSFGHFCESNFSEDDILSVTNHASILKFAVLYYQKTCLDSKARLYFFTMCAVGIPKKSCDVLKDGPIQFDVSVFFC